MDGSLVALALYALVIARVVTAFAGSRLNLNFEALPVRALYFLVSLLLPAISWLPETCLKEGSLKATATWWTLMLWPIPLTLWAAFMHDLIGSRTAPAARVWARVYLFGSLLVDLLVYGSACMVIGLVGM
jgi:hypothetical protein